MIITLPRGLNIDIDNVPENFEEIVQKAFGEFTEGTNPKYMFEDKLYFIDLMVENLHKAGDSDDRVYEIIKESFAHMLDKFGEMPDTSEFLDIPFMVTCYERGNADHSLYSKLYARNRHDNEKIEKILCRAIRAVMNYSEGGE